MSINNNILVFKPPISTVQGGATPKSDVFQLSHDTMGAMGVVSVQRFHPCTHLTTVSATFVWLSLKPLVYVLSNIVLRYIS